MTNFEKIKNMNIDELANFLEELHWYILADAYTPEYDSGEFERIITNVDKTVDPNGYKHLLIKEV